MQLIPMNATTAWRVLLHRILTTGALVRPRNAVVPGGRATLECAPGIVRIDMAEPVVAAPARKLSYRFMAAEALWILDGNDRVDAIAPYNPNIAQFSDDGEQFFGAYGPRLMDQAMHVIMALATDPDTRQAVLTLWRPNPPKTKDVPCTIALIFQERKRALNLHVSMRSSDTWMGVPYDVFTFSMIAAWIAWRVNRLRRARPAPRLPIERLGHLMFYAASSHLYEEDWVPARAILHEPSSFVTCAPLSMDFLQREDGWNWLWSNLVCNRDHKMVGCAEHAMLTPKWDIRARRPQTSTVLL